MKQIILDTNFLMIPANFKVDIFEEIRRICDFGYKLFILDKTLDELNNIIEKQSTKHKAAAQLALEMIKINAIDIIKTEQGHTDNIILNIAEKGNTIVATQDSELKKSLEQKNIPLIVLRQKSHLMLKGL